MKSFINQILKFFGISGVGWCIDFLIYFFLTFVLGWPVFYSNCVSSILAVSLVFFVATKNIFKKADSRMPIGMKYLIYVSYQMILLLLVSSLGEYIVKWITNFAIYSKDIQMLAKIIAKIFITPITMLMNFIVMKIMVERV